MRIIYSLVKIAFCGGLLFMGFSAGVCVKVFITRGVPVVHGGGELLLLLAIPVSIAVGYYSGIKKTQQRRRSDETVGHTD